MTKRAAIYVRVSSERQAREDRVSVEVQLADCEALCAARGYTVVARYIDKEKYRVRGKLVQPSGQRKDRPQYKTMLAAAYAGEFDIIVAWKEDRLYRGLYAAMPFSEMLDELGRQIEVVLVKETFDQRMLGIKAALGKIESDNIRERMIAGRRARLERGEVPGGDQVKYGYRKEDKSLVLNDDEVPVIHLIYGWYLNGENSLEIRRRLNAAGISPRKGKKWSKASIKNILTLEAYATGQMSTALDGETFYIPCPPIISPEVWEKARELRADNRPARRSIKNDFLCAGLVYCACSWKCTTRTAINPRNNHTIYGYYVCQRQHVDPESMPADCVSTIGSKKVDEKVWRLIRKVCDHPQLLQRAINEKLASLRAEQDDLAAATVRLQKALDDLAMERQWVITQARKKSITEEDMGLQLAALDLQQMGYRRELRQAEAAELARSQAQALEAWAEQYLSEIKTGIQALDTDPETLSPEQQRNLAEELEAWRFAEDFPNDSLAQLRRAVLVEKQRTVKALISRVIVARTPKVNGHFGRKITPILALDVPVDEILSQVTGDQSPDYQPSEEISSIAIEQTG